STIRAPARSSRQWSTPRRSTTRRAIPTTRTGSSRTPPRKSSLSWRRSPRADESQMPYYTLVRDGASYLNLSCARGQVFHSLHAARTSCLSKLSGSSNNLIAARNHSKRNGPAVRREDLFSVCRGDDDFFRRERNRRRAYGIDAI